MQNKTVLITGGTGSFGKAMAERLFIKAEAKKVIIYSRDEFKQFQMQGYYNEDFPKVLRFFIGDVRDKERLNRAMKGADYVFHAAALKQVPACEYNPFEAVKTNILGAQNVIECALSNKVRKVVALSTDKAVSSINLYGATKLVAEKLFINANTFGEKKTVFSVVRYGNVLGSRGSVVEIFREQAKQGIIYVTDKQMTRFWWLMEDAIDFVLSSLQYMQGGEIFVPKLRSSYVVDLASAICKECRIRSMGIRPGEKIHETLISSDEAGRTYDLGWCFCIEPDNEYFDFGTMPMAMPVGLNFEYNSKLVHADDDEEIKEWVQEILTKV